MKFSTLGAAVSTHGRVYIAGPMTGYPHFNFPAFHRAAEEIRELGFDVVSPAELDDSSSQKAAEQSEWGDPDEYHAITGMTWADFLARDVKVIADGKFDFMFCLPGWQQSRGARLETFVARLCGVPVFLWAGDHSEPIRTEELARVWSGQTRRDTDD